MTFTVAAHVLRASPRGMSSRSSANCSSCCSVTLPGHAPVFVRRGRCDHELISVELVEPLLVLSDQATNERAFDVIGEAAPRLVDGVATERRFVPALRVLHRRSVRRRLW